MQHHGFGGSSPGAGSGPLLSYPEGHFAYIEPKFYNPKETVMTAYEYDNIPDSFETISAMPADLFSEVQRTFKAAQDSGLLMAKEAKIAHVYDRKGYLTTDELGGPRNAAYGSKTDDIVIQLTIRIQQPH